MCIYSSAHSAGFLPTSYGLVFRYQKLVTAVAWSVPFSDLKKVLAPPHVLCSALCSDHLTEGDFATRHGCVSKSSKLGPYVFPPRSTVLISTSFMLAQNSETKTIPSVRRSGSEGIMILFAGTHTSASLAQQLA